MAWKRGALERAVVRSKHGGRCQVRYGERTVTLDTRALSPITLDGGLQAR